MIPAGFLQGRSDQDLSDLFNERMGGLARFGALLAGEGYEFCGLTARTPDREGYQLMRSEPLPGDDGLPRPERITRLRAAGMHAVQYGDDTVFDGLPQGFFEIGVRRAATVVLSAGTSAEGLLTIGRHRPEPYSPEEMTFFELVGTLLAYAIANEGRVRASEAEAEEQAIVAEAAAAVARESSPLAITRALRGAVSRFISSPYVSFGFLEPGMVEFVTKQGPLRPANIGEYFTRAFAEGQVAVPATAGRIRAGESLPEVERVGVQAHLLTTAYSAGSVVGLLLIGSREESFVPGKREERFCRLIADIVGPAMANARTAQRQRWEAEDQRVLAEVGAVAAREATPQDILKALRAPLSSFIAQPVALFGFREPDAIVIPQPNGELRRLVLGEYAELLEEEGQIHGDQVPDDLAAAGMGSLQIRAVCATAVRSAGATIGYLIRRLDENTGPENFLRHAFKIQVDSPEWKQLEQGFLKAFDAIATISEALLFARRSFASGASQRARRDCDSVHAHRFFVLPHMARIPRWVGTVKPLG